MILAKGKFAVTAMLRLAKGLLARLFHRSMVVSYDSCLSSKREILSRVPQGSILGPLILYKDLYYYYYYYPTSSSSSSCGSWMHNVSQRRALH